MRDAWLGRLVHRRWREEIVGDLMEEHRARVGQGEPRAWSRLRLEMGLARAGAASRWHAWIGVSDPRRDYRKRGGVGMTTMIEVIQDVRYAVRSLRRAPLFAVVALLTLGAGTGLTLAVLAVVNGVLLEPLDYPEPDELVLLQGQPGARYGVSMPTHLLFAEGAESLEAVSVWQGWAPVIEGADGSPLRLAGASVSASFFQVAGVSPRAGRFFDAGDGAPGHEPVVVLGHDAWTTHFGADPEAVGSILELDDGRYRIVGVAPPDFRDPVSRGMGFADREVWRAAPPSFEEARAAPGQISFWSVGRLGPGASTARLTDEMRALVRAGYPDHDEIDRFAADFRAITVKDAVVEDVRPTLWVLLLAVGAVLLIACANLANLLLSRATVRAGELAVRTSLGAGRGRLVRQLLTESLVLAGAGALLGLGLAMGGVRALVGLAGPALPRAAEVGVDGTVVLFAVGTAVGTAVLFGVAPALRMSGRSATLASGGVGRSRLGGRENGGLRKWLVVVETALAMTLLSGAGLLSGTFLRLQSVDPGFEAEGVLTVQVGLGSERFPDPALQTEALLSAEGALAALPSVRAAGSISDLPLSGAVNSTRIQRADETSEAAAGRSNVLVRAVTSGYFEALGIAWIRGQPLTPNATAGTEEVAAVNREFVRRFYPDEDPVGRRVVVRGVERRITGVVEDVREFDLTSSDPDPVLYTPYPQEREGWMRSGMTLVLRSTGDDVTALAEGARGALARAAPDILVGRVDRLSTLVERHVRVPRFRAVLILVFSGLAVLLAAVGLGGVVAYNVSQRIPEIGLRQALGAERGEVVGMLLREVVVLTVAGVALGLVGALLSGRVLSGMLFQVEPGDPLVLGGSGALLTAVALLAGWLPARRAARVDPSEALRAE